MPRPSPLFNEAKATQAAAHLLRARRGFMNYQLLLKLLYIADREALIRWGRPITTDTYVSMHQGPVLQATYSLIRESRPPASQGIWNDHISTHRNSYRVQLIKDPGNDELSLVEEKLLDEILKEHGGKTRLEILRYVHSLSEWRDPLREGKKSVPLQIQDILVAGGKSASEIQEIQDELDHIAIVKGLICPK